MNLDQLQGRKKRYTSELSLARCTIPRNKGRIERLKSELAAIELAIEEATRGQVIEPAPNEPQVVLRRAP